MLTQRMTRGEHIFMALFFGSLFVYFFYGALVDDLFLPGRHGPGVHLHGLAAWLVTGAPLAIYVGLLVRAGIFMFPSGSIQFAAEITFLTAGVTLLLLGSRICSNCNESVSSVSNKTVAASCK